MSGLITGYTVLNRHWL